MLAEDPVVQLLLGALDEVLAPIISVLDCFDAYLDPRLAPLDFVDYMSGWLLVSQVEYWTEETRRATLSSTVPRSKWRGTAKSPFLLLCLFQCLKIPMQSHRSR